MLPADVLPGSTVVPVELQPQPERIRICLAIAHSLPWSITVVTVARQHNSVPQRHKVGNSNLFSRYRLRLFGLRLGEMSPTCPLTGRNP